MHLKEQYNKTLMVDIGWISTQSRFFHDKTGLCRRAHPERRGGNDTGTGYWEYQHRSGRIG